MRVLNSGPQQAYRSQASSDFGMSNLAHDTHVVAAYTRSPEAVSGNLQRQFCRLKTARLDTLTSGADEVADGTALPESHLSPSTDAQAAKSVQLDRC